MNEESRPLKSRQVVRAQKRHMAKMMASHQKHEAMKAGRMALAARVRDRKAREKAAGIKPSEQRLSLTNHRNGPCAASKRGNKNRRILSTFTGDGQEWSFHATKGGRCQRVPA